MAIQWFYQSGGGQPSGPVDFKELRRLAEAGIVRPDTLVRLPPEGDSARWVRAEQVRGLFQQSDSSASRAGAARPGSAARRESTPLSPPPLENAPAFDPYYVWLGIRPSDRPLNHYRLLGIADFEDNPEVISNAADRQMAHVRAFQNGEHAEVCQKLLNELARARVCLLDPAKKAAYDRALQQAESAMPPPVPRLSASQVRQEAELARRRVADRDRERESPPNASPEKPDGVHPFTWAAVIVGAGTVLLLLWALVFRGGSEPQQQAGKDQPPLAAAQSAEAEDSAPAPQAVEWTPADDAVVWTPELGKSLGIPPPPDWQGTSTPAGAPAAESKSAPPTGHVEILELADLAELVGPSVVQVDVTGPEGVGTGSGFVLDKQGTIVTNFHVIEDATAGRIVFSDRTSAPITGYLGVWPEKDIALLRVECPPEKLHPLRLATSAPRQGERVAAFGSPLGLQQSVSVGIVSAVRESKELRALGPIQVNARLIQTTAPISQGNSGGPLVDMKGLVVGVNTWTFRFLGGENVNFAVAAVELPRLLLAKSETSWPLPASDPAADGVRRILSRAREHLNAGEYDRAIADCTEAIRLDPENAGAYHWRGLAYNCKDDDDSAIADYSEAIRLDPTDAVAYSNRGSAYRSKGDFDRAIADFTEAIRLDPKAPRVYYLRGLAYQAKGERAAAERDFAKAKELGYKP